jgi:hypothetical protein
MLTKSRRQVQAMTDEQLDRIVRTPAAKDVTRWEVTDEVSGERRPCRVVRNLTGGHVPTRTGLAVDYAEWLGIVPGMTLDGNSNGVFTTQAGDVLMECRL